METETPAPAAAPPHPLDRAAHVLVWVGNLMHGAGAALLKSRNAELAADLARTRARLAELNDEYTKLVTEPATVVGDRQDPVPVDRQAAAAADGLRDAADVDEPGGADDRYEDAR